MGCIQREGELLEEEWIELCGLVITKCCSQVIRNRAIVIKCQFDNVLGILSSLNCCMFIQIFLPVDVMKCCHSATV